MGMSYTIDPERRLVHVRGRGVLSTDDHHELTSRLLADPRFDPTYQSLGDFSEVTDVLVDTMALAHTAAVPMFDAGTRHAIVATSCTSRPPGWSHKPRATNAAISVVAGVPGDLPGDDAVSTLALEPISPSAIDGGSSEWLSRRRPRVRPWGYAARGGRGSASPSC
jgi:hypothetical protein